MTRPRYTLRELLLLWGPLLAILTLWIGVEWQARNRPPLEIERRVVDVQTHERVSSEPAAMPPAHAR